LAFDGGCAYLLSMNTDVIKAASATSARCTQPNPKNIGPEKFLRLFQQKALLVLFSTVLIISGLCIGTISSSFAQTTQSPLKGLEGKKRIILLFSKSRSDATLDKQIDLLRARRRDLSDRDTVVLVVEARSDVVSAIGYVSIPRGAALDLRRIYEKEKTRFFGILIGKDGGEKSRWTRVRQPQEMFDQIDAMPMRQQEMRSSQTN